MRKLVKWLLVPSAVLLGMAFLSTSQAEARRWVRYYYGPVYRPAPVVTYVAPAPVYAPAPAAVHVDAPGVTVDVAPPAVGVYPHGPAVVAPPRIITPWFQMW